MNKRNPSSIQLILAVWPVLGLIVLVCGTEPYTAAWASPGDGENRGDRFRDKVAWEAVSTFSSPAPPTLPAHIPMLWGLTQSSLSKGSSAYWKRLPFPGARQGGKYPHLLPTFPQTSPSVLASGLTPPPPLGVSLPDPVPLQPWVSVTSALGMEHQGCTALRIPPLWVACTPLRACSLCLSSSPFPNLSPRSPSDLKFGF